VVVNYDADEASVGNKFSVIFATPDGANGELAPQTMSGVVKAGKQVTQTVGRIHCRATGETPFEIEVTGAEGNNGELFRLRKVELRTVPVGK
jgi:hypothetical protein